MSSIRIWIHFLILQVLWRLSLYRWSQLQLKLIYAIKLRVDYHSLKIYLSHAQIVVHLHVFAPLDNITSSDNFLHFLVNLFMDPRGIMYVLVLV